MCVHVCRTCVLCFYFCKCMCVVSVLCLCLYFVCMFVSVCVSVPISGAMGGARGIKRTLQPLGSAWCSPLTLGQDALWVSLFSWETSQGDRSAPCWRQTMVRGARVVMPCRAWSGVRGPGARQTALWAWEWMTGVPGGWQCPLWQRGLGIALENIIECPGNFQGDKISEMCSLDSASTYNTHKHTFTHKHMNIRTQHTNTNIRHRDHSHTSIHNTDIQIYKHTTLHSHTQTYKHTYKHTWNTYKHNTYGKHTYTHLYTNRTHTTHTYHTNITHIYTHKHTMHSTLTHISHQHNTHIYTQTHYAQHPHNTLSSTIHTHRLTHRHSHHGLGLTALLSVGQEECPCLVSPGAVCSPELSVSPLRANTLQAEWRRSVTVPQTYTNIEDMADIFSVLRDPDAQLKNCPGVQLSALRGGCCA